MDSDILGSHERKGQKKYEFRIYNRWLKGVPLHISKKITFCDTPDWRVSDGEMFETKLKSM